jgi:hypothetical protein
MAAPPLSESRRLPAPPGSPINSSSLCSEEELVDFAALPANKLRAAEHLETSPSSYFSKPGIPYGLALRVLETEPEARALFESPLHLELLPLPDETKAFVRVLKNPHTGGVVYLIGTCHLSKASRDDVKLLIEAVEPDVVAVEVSIHEARFGDWHQGDTGVFCN